MVTSGYQVRDGVDLGGWEVGEEFVREYLAAVDDPSPGYFKYSLVPPLALAARTMGSLLEHLALPPGAIHSLQEITTLAPIPFGQEVTAKASLGPPKRRGGMDFVTAGFTLKDLHGHDVLGGKSTVLIPGASAPSANEREQVEMAARSELEGPNAEGSEATGEGALRGVVKTIRQEQLSVYSRVSGDHNPLHLDPSFAATTRFGGVIAHGMLILAFISEMMAVAFERAWLETGALRVRFKGAAYLGDRVQAQGRVTKQESLSQGSKLSCAVVVRNQENGLELIRGTASVVLTKR